MTNTEIPIWCCIFCLCADCPAAGSLLGRVESVSKAVCFCRNCTANQSQRATPQGFLNTSANDRAFQLLSQEMDDEQRERLLTAWQNEGKRRRRKTDWEIAPEVTTRTGVMV